MRRQVIKVLALVFALAMLFALAACKPNPRATGIEITSPPAKTEYVEGERFDATGMVVSCLYDDGSKQTVTDYTIDKNGELVAGDKQITVTYGEFSATVAITVTANDAVVTGIKVTAQPTKTNYYEGETFDPAGMVVKKVMSDGTEVSITDYQIDKTGALTLGDTQITVTYQGFTATVSITVSEKTAKELQVLSYPDKTEYAPGETFDATGMEVKVLYTDGSREPVTDYTVDKTVLSESDRYVTVSWNGFSATVAITVKQPSSDKSVTDVEIYSGADLTYTRTMDVSSIVRYKAVYSDGTKDEDWTYAMAEDLDSFYVEGNELVVKVSLFVKNVEIQKQLRVPFSSQAITVSELLTKPADGETVYELEGVLVAVASTMGRVEYILMDPESGAFIGVAGITSTGSMFDGDYLPRFEVGDKVEFPVTLVQTETKANNSDSDKIYASFAGGSIWETGVVEKDVEYTVDYSAATEISDQQGLEAFLGASARSENHYKLVKLNGPLSAIRYGTKPVHYRFYYGTLSFAKHKIDGVSPVFMNSNQQYITGNTVGELLAGDENWNPADWNNPGQAYKDVYALFIGGNSYYHEFIILSSDAVTAMPRYETGVQLEGPDKQAYVVGEKLDLTGAQLEVTFNYGENEFVAVTSEMLDELTVPDMKSPGDFTVKGTYKGFEFSFEITVKSEFATAIEFTQMPSETEFKLAEGFQAVIDSLCKLSITVTYENLEPEVIPVTEGMISMEGEWTEGQHIITVTYLGATEEVHITVVNSALSVAEIKQLPAGTEVYEMQGIVVSSAFISGTASSPVNGEVFVKDKTTADIIGVKGLGITFADPLAGLEVGDEIIVSVTIGVTSTNTSHSECGKLAATIVAGSKPTVLSKNNNAMIALDSAVTISSQEELVAFLENAEARSANAYKLVKFVAGTKFIGNSGSLYITFTGTNLDTVEVDGIRPYLHSMNQSMTLGDATFAELLLGEDTLPSGFANPFTLEKDVYLLYVGGQGIYYHQFLLLGAEYIVPVAQ